MNLRSLVPVALALFGVLLTAPTASATVVSVPITNGFSISADPDPANIAQPSRSRTVAGVSGDVARVVVRIDDITHTHPDDLDILIVAPNGDRVMLVSDAGLSFDLTSAYMVFTAGGAAVPDSGAIVSGYFGVSNYSSSGVDDTAEASLGGTGTLLPGLSSLAGRSPNGIWTVVVRDDSGGDAGFVGSVTINLTVVGAPSGVIDGAGADVDVLATNNSFPISWQPGYGDVQVQQYHSCIIPFAAAVTTSGSATCSAAPSPAATDFLGLANGPYTRTLTPTLTDGRYRSCVYLQDLDDNFSIPSCSDGFWVDTVAPGAPGSVDDGSVAASRVGVPISWAAGTDGGSGVASYDWCITTTTTCAGAVQSGSTAGTSVTTSGALLPLGKLFACVRTVDAAGHVSAYTCGDGVTVPKLTLGKLTLKPASFLRGTKVAAKLPLASVSVTRVAKLTARVERVVSGYRVGTKCVAKRPKVPANPKRCTLYVPIGASASATGTVGVNSLRATYAMTKALARGTYFLAITATGDGETATARAVFRVL